MYSPCLSLKHFVTILRLQLTRTEPLFVGVNVALMGRSYNKSSAVAEKTRHASVRLFVICSNVLVQFGS